tara:strand:- start:21007 stop:22680 length:1674 start_codon:yes stop_codon:yes gene_type:complete
MADEIEKLAGNLSDLNKVTLTAGVEFKGFTKRLIEVSDATSKAGKKWTIFARLVSGSPLWRLQNKFRAFVDILGQIEQASQQNAKLAKEQNDAVIQQVQAFKTLEPQLEKLNALREQQSTQAGIISLKHAEENEQIREAIKGTLAYNVAILEGVDVNEAMIKGLDELIEKGKQQAQVFEEAQKVAQFQKGMKTEAGRAGISADIKAEQEALRKTDFFLSKKRGTKTIATKEGTAEVEKTLFEDMRDNMLASFKQGDKLKKFQEKMAKKTLRYRKGMVGLQKTMKPVLNYAFKVLIMLMLGILAFLVLAKFIHDALGILSEMGVVDDIKNIASLVLENIMLVFSMIGALLSGDIYTFIDYALQFVDNLMLIGLGIIKVVLKGLLALAIGVFYTGLDIIHRFFTDDDFRSAVFNIAKKALFIFLAAYVVKQIAIQMLTVAAIYAIPLLIAVAVGAFIMAAIKKLTGSIPFFASGGVSSGGMAVVGEGGPELVSLPAGARVHNNTQSSGMMKSNTVNNHVNVTINAKDTSDAELRRIADQVGNMITNKINRSVSSSGMLR